MRCLRSTCNAQRLTSLHSYLLRPLPLAAALSLAACSLVPDTDALRIDEVEQALLPIAKVALDTGQLETAKRLYRRLLEVDEQSYSARMGLGDVAFKDRRSADAARWYLAAQGSATVSEQLYDALLWHGRAALDAGRLAASRRSFERLAAGQGQAPTISVAWAFNGIGLTFLLEGDLEGAVTFMEKAVNAAPGEQMFADNLSRALDMRAELRSQAMAETPPAQPAQDRAPSTIGESDGAVPAPLPDASEREQLPTAPAVSPAEDAAPPAAEYDRPVADEPTARQAAGESEASAAAAPPVQQVEPEAEQIESAATRVEPPAAPVELAADVLEPQRQPSEENVETPPAQSPVSRQEQAADEALWPNGESGYVVNTEDGLFVQMGAFAERATADTVAYLLGDVTFETVRVVGPEDDAEDALYRVRIGPLESNALAELSDDLAAEGYGRPRLLEADSAQEFHDGGEELSATDEERPPGMEPSLELTAFIVQEDTLRFVQLGAFEVRMTANRLADRLRPLTEHLIAVEEAGQDGGAMYRVRVGPVESDEALEELTAVLAASGVRIE